jgi:hypothetical protein
LLLDRPALFALLKRRADDLPLNQKRVDESSANWPRAVPLLGSQTA